MKNKLQKHENNNYGPLYALFGALTGGLVGATVMLLFAPQSGRQTRLQIQGKGIELRDRTTKNLKKAVEQVRSESGKFTTEVKEKAVELKQLGQDKLVKQLDQVSVTLDATKKAIQSA